MFYDARRRQLIAADHLIKHISSNPLITRGPDDEGDPAKRPQSLVMYLESLRKTRDDGRSISSSRATATRSTTTAR